MAYHGIPPLEQARQLIGAKGYAPAYASSEEKAEMERIFPIFCGGGPSGSPFISPEAMATSLYFGGPVGLGIAALGKGISNMISESPDIRGSIHPESFEKYMLGQRGGGGIGGLALHPNIDRSDEARSQALGLGTMLAYDEPEGGYPKKLLYDLNAQNLIGPDKYKEYGIQRYPGYGGYSGYGYNREGYPKVRLVGQDKPGSAGGVGMFMKEGGTLKEPNAYDYAVWNYKQGGGLLGKTKFIQSEYDKGAAYASALLSLLSPKAYETHKGRIASTVSPDYEKTFATTDFALSPKLENWFGFGGTGKTLKTIRDRELTGTPAQQLAQGTPTPPVPKPKPKPPLRVPAISPQAIIQPKQPITTPAQQLAGGRRKMRRYVGGNISYGGGLSAEEEEWLKKYKRKGYLMGARF